MLEVKDGNSGANDATPKLKPVSLSRKRSPRYSNNTTSKDELSASPASNLPEIQPFGQKADFFVPSNTTKQQNISKHITSQMPTEIKRS